MSEHDQRQADGAPGEPYRRLRPSGSYRELRSFQVTTIVYNATVAFCERFLDKRSRTVDQMVQAARSGRQNIAEGSRAAAASSQTELRLVNTARASLDELLLDYEDFLRQRHLPQWTKDDPQALAVRDIGRQTDPSERKAQTYSSWLQHADPGIAANAIICLIHQANYLLDKQIAGLERKFVQDGGYSEKLAAARIAKRSMDGQSSPACPLCGKQMVLRTARKGPRAGSQFWGASDSRSVRETRGRMIRPIRPIRLIRPTPSSRYAGAIRQFPEQFGVVPVILERHVGRDGMVNRRDEPA